jgi:hypothetical protein
MEVNGEVKRKWKTVCLCAMGIQITEFWNKYYIFCSIKWETTNSDKTISFKKLLFVMEFRSHVYVYGELGNGTVATLGSIYIV